MTTVVPHEGVDDVCLGMTRQEVREALGAEPRRRQAREGLIDDRPGLAISYCPDSEAVDFLELSTNMDAALAIRGETIDEVFDTPVDELIEAVRRLSPLDDREAERGYSFKFPELDLAFWRPTVPPEPAESTDEDEEDLVSDAPDGTYFSTVGIGAEGFFANSYAVLLALDMPDAEARSLLKARADRMQSLALAARGRAAPRWSLRWPDRPFDQFRRLTDLLRETPLPRMGLCLFGRDVADAWLECVAGLDCLVSLHVFLAEITDQSLRYLAALPSLVDLAITHSPVTSAGAVRLRNCPRLRRLDLSETQVDDAAIETIAGLTDLRVLKLEHTAITGRKASLLANLRDLRHVHLSYTKVDDRGLEALAQLSGLEELLMLDTNVTNDGLASLRGRESLRFVNFTGCQRVSREAIDALQDTLPNAIRI
jgi:hypothetical protein